VSSSFFPYLSFYRNFTVTPLLLHAPLSILGVELQGEIYSDILQENPDLKLAGILPSFVDRTRVSKDVIHHLEKEYGQDVFSSYIRMNTHLSQASSLGKTVFEHNPKSNGAKDYKAVTKEFLERIKG
jgi:chromosome partitioning protein